MNLDKAKSQIEEFQKATDSGAQATAEFFNSLKNDGLKNYLQSVKAGEASVDGYISSVLKANNANKQLSISSQLVSVGMGLLTDTVGTLAKIGLDMAIDFAVQKLDEWIRRDEILIEQAQTLQKKYDEVKESVQQNIHTLSNLEQEYDTLNKKFQSGNLNTEESERYRDIVQQIAEISPSLVEGYDAEGNAIIRKNDALKESIRLQKEVERKALGEKVSPENLKTTLNADLAAQEKSSKGYFSKGTNAYGDTVWGGEFDRLEGSLANLYGWSGDVISVQGGQSSIDFARDLLDSLGIENIEAEIAKYTTEEGFNATALLQDYADTIAENADVIIADAKSKYGGYSVTGASFEDTAGFFKEQVGKYNGANAGAEATSEAMRGHLMELAQYNEAYSQMSDEQAILFDSMLKRFDSRDYAELGDEEIAELTNRVNSMVEKVAGNTEVQDILDNMFNLDSSNLSVDEYNSQLNTLFGQLENVFRENFSSEEVADFKLKLGINENTYQDQLQQVRAKLSNEFKGRENWLTMDALQVACTIEGDHLSWDDLMTKITQTKRATRDLNQSFTKLSTPLNEISQAESLFAQATEEANAQGTVSAETLNDLAALDQDYLKCLDDSNGKLTLSADKFKKVTDGKREAAQEAVKAELAESVWSAALNGSNKEMDTHIAKLMAMSNENDDTIPDGPGVLKAKEAITDFINYRRELGERDDSQPATQRDIERYAREDAGAQKFLNDLKSISEEQLVKVGITVDKSSETGEITSLFLGEGDDKIELKADTDFSEIENGLLKLQETANETPLFSVDEAAEEADEALASLLDKRKELDSLENALNSGASSNPLMVQKYSQTREEIDELIQKIAQLPPEVLTTYNLQVNKDGKLEYLDPQTEKTITITAETLDTGVTEYLGEILQQKAEVGNDVNISFVVQNEEANQKIDETNIKLARFPEQINTEIVVDTIWKKTTENSNSEKKSFSPKSNSPRKSSSQYVAQASGTGISGVPETGNVLVGEEAPEMYVNRRTGRWQLVGMLGAEFIHAEKGDIIFNARQTRSLLNNGFAASRGKAFAKGTEEFLNFSGGRYVSQTDWSKWSRTGSRGLGGTVILKPKVENKDVYLADIDELYEAETRLKALEQDEEALNHALKMTDSLSEQVNLTRQLNENYRQQQAELHAANERRDELIKANVEKLRSAGFNVYYDPEQNRLMVANMEHINELMGGTQEETNALRQEYEKLISETEKLNETNQKSSAEWLKHEEAIRKNRLEMVEKTLQGYKDFISYADDFDLWGKMDTTKVDVLRNQLIYLKQAFDQNLLSLDEFTKKSREIGKEIYSEQKSALKEIVELTKDLIKQETGDRVDALNDQIDKYQEIIDLKKKALQDEADEKDYSKERDQKLKELSKLQSQIARLSLDDSREAAYERMQLEEELAEKQQELTDFQENHAREAQIDALDEEAKRFKKAKDEQIEYEESKIDTEEKLYEAAVSRIDSEGEKLKDALISYVKEYKDAIDGENSVKTAWEAAMQAKQGYNSIKDAFPGINNEIIGGKNAPEITAKVSQMRHNSNLWQGSSKEERERLASENEDLAKKIQQLLGDSGTVFKKDGTWYFIGSSGKKELLYSIYHKGGIVGDNMDIRDDEVFALLQKGEMVLTRAGKESLYEAVDFVKEMRDRFGADISGRFAPFSPTFPSLTERYESAAREVSHLNDTVFSPTINVEFHHQGGMKDSDAVKYGNMIANTALDSLQNMFVKTGISTHRFAGFKQ